MAAILSRVDELMKRSQVLYIRHFGRGYLLTANNTMRNPFAHIGKKYNAHLVIFTWKMFILTDLTDPSISSRI